MPTFTTNMNLSKPIPGAGPDTGIWGSELNPNFDLLDQLARWPIVNFVQFGLNTFAYDQVSPIVIGFGVAGSSDLNIALPSATSQNGKLFYLQKTDSGIGNVVLNPSGGQTINGQVSNTLTAQFKYVCVISDGTNWLIVFNN